MPKDPILAVPARPVLGDDDMPRGDGIVAFDRPRDGRQCIVGFLRRCRPRRLARRHDHAFVWRSHLTAVALAAATVFAACGPGNADRGRVVWPRPPAVPRIGFVRAFANEIDLDTSVWQALARAVAGKRAPEEISRPTGLALSNDERRLYVACAAVAKLYEFDLDNNTVRELGEAGSAGLQFPYDIAIDASDNIYVTDSTLRSVLVLDRDGHKIRQLGDAAMFVRPTGIAIDRGRDLIYVADGANRKSTHHTIEVFRRDGSHLRSIGTQGSEPGELNAPTYLAVAPGGDLYVADTMNFRVQIFHPSGAYVGHFGQQGNSPGPADRIKGMAFDAFGRLHVVASDRALVHVFSSDLQPIMWYGGRADELAFFDMPTAIAIDSNNRIYVANFHFGRVNQYQVIATSSEAASVLPSPGAEARVDVSEAADERWQGS